jgi:hypothetical protein
MKKILAATGAAALALTAGSALAQTSTTQQRNPIADILGAVFGDRAGATTSIEAQWAAGQTPLANQRAQFESRVDSEVTTGALNQTTGARLKADYYELVQLEARYGADRRFTTAERTTLADRYGDLTQVLADRAYADAGTTANPEVAEGRAQFDARVNSAVAARRLTRTQGTRLKSDYVAVAQLEAGYLRDGMLSQAERADLDARLDALDMRLGDTAFAAAPLTPRARLDAIARALPTNGMSRAMRTQFQVELQDISQLELAYARLAATAEERAYLERRIAELETRAGIRVGASSY